MPGGRVPFSKAVSKTSSLKGNARWASRLQSDVEDASGPDRDSGGTWAAALPSPGRDGTRRGGKPPIPSPPAFGVPGMATGRQIECQRNDLEATPAGTDRRGDRRGDPMRRVGATTGSLHRKTRLALPRRTHECQDRPECTSSPRTTERVRPMRRAVLRSPA